MKNLLAVLITAFCTFVNAQSNVSPNLIYPGNLTGTTATTSTGGGYSGGSAPGYNSSTNTIMFGYTQSTVAYTYAFSQALRDSGMTITGYNYSWEYLNQDMSSGNLSAKLNFAGIDGTSLYSRGWTLGPTTNWTTVNGSETFINNGILASNIANFSLSFNGKDSRYWAGYYGPQVRNPTLSLNYTFNACSTNPLSSPTCPGYAQAYLTQQCSANPLYSTQCPGYAQAYFTQQCSANPLYDPSCPGYATAYLNYQCSINPLYSTTCTGYETAYFDQQCSISPLYSQSCRGYGTAYHDSQCRANPLYATDCVGYAQAYFDQQCSLNGLYNQRCSNYSEAYAKKMLLEQQGLASTVATSGTFAKTTELASSPSTVTIVSDPVVNQTLTSTTTSTSPANAATAVVPLVSAPQGVSNVTTTSVSTGAPPPTAETKNKGPQTARESIQARQRENAQKEAVAKGKNLANEMGKSADMESQKQIQNVVIAAMGFTPGFDVYKNATVPDSIGYQPYSVYTKQINVDNVKITIRMFGPSDRLHETMVEMQWKIK